MNYLKNLGKNMNYNNIVMILLVLVILAAIFQPAFLFPSGTQENFEASDADSDEKTMAFFGVSWCGYCKKAKPEWDKFAAKMNGKGGKVVYIDCDENSDLAKKHGIKSYPTIKLFPKGMANMDNVIGYEGERTADKFAEFFESN